ncbi:RNA polymerase Rpb8 [Penicillium chermesinum]|uniref:RNA polymerase Rpb8 n=1 Tax=Penicillium chermesinum TaxID=63820 RepID=A0A9W9TWF4_9EURO|nr:RNA polymerase Rpb8 [Penicillium chermesinum]KAJ5246321.1 RNA polymerase Rpb8 [Penicillium chermesinum]
MADPLLFEDTFAITSINAQKYDRVSRLTCTSTDASTTFTLDVNSELYPCAVGDWREVSMGEQTLANDYDYVCHGKVYRFEEGQTKDTMAVFVSFGGLLLYLEGPYRKLALLKIDHVYLLLKK